MLDRIAEFFVFGIVPLAVGMLVTPVASVAAEQVLKGEVIYRERIALPPGAEVTVQLADVSLADAPAAIVAEQKITPTGQVPVPFELKFDTSAILEKNTYALQARIAVDDKLMFINDERHQVDPLADAPQTIVVKMVKQQADSDERASIFGQPWTLTFIDGRIANDLERKSVSIEEVEGKRARVADSRDAGKRGDLFLDLIEELLQQLVGRVLRAERIEHHRQHGIGAIAAIELVDGDERPKEKTGAEEQQHRRRDLTRREQCAQCTAAGDGAAA